MLNKNRLLLVGIDGATNDIIHPLISKRKLPTFEKLIANGSTGTINSVLPPHAASGWTSLLTGKNPGKHDIYDFYDRINGSYHRHLITTHSIKAKTLWQILDTHDRRSIVMNLPVSYPPTPLNGIMISGMLTPRDEKFTYPGFLSEVLAEHGYIIDILHQSANSMEEYLKLARQTMKIRQSIFVNLLQENEWDFAAIDFTTIDRLQQTIWENQDDIEAFYIEMDTLLGEMLAKITDERTNVMITSCYGAKSIKKKFFVNEWLWELGLLDKKISTQPPSIPDFWDDFYEHHKKDQKLITSFLKNTRLTKYNIGKFMPGFMMEVLKKITPTPIRKAFPRENLLIDWDQTKAYFTSQMSLGININLKGREPHGIVQPGDEYERLRDHIIRELYHLKDPHTFNNVIEEVYRGEEIFFGEYCDYAPDIIFIPRNYEYVLRPTKRTNKHSISHANDIYPILSGPDPKGIFIAQGPAIRKGAKLSNLKMYDIAPTILHLLHIPIPADIDGNILFNLLPEEEYMMLNEDRENIHLKTESSAYRKSAYVLNDQIV